MSKKGIETLIQRAKDAFADKLNQSCFFTGFFFGIVTYAYVMLNNINNHDNVSMTPGGYFMGVSSGRWMLTLLGTAVKKVWGNYNIPVFNILLAICFLSLTAVLVVRFFEIKRKSLAFLIAAITVCFPAFGGTALYSFTVHFYAFAVLLMAVAAVLAKRDAWYCWLLSALLAACSMGLYQAYLPFFAMLLVLRLMSLCLRPQVSGGRVVRTGVRYLAILAASYALYRLFLLLVLKLTNETLGDYQGIASMGKLELKQLFQMLKATYYHYYLLPSHDFCSVSATPAIRGVILLLFLFTAAVLIWRWRERRPGKILMLLLGFALLPIASNAIIIMVPDGFLYELMCLGLLSVFYLPIVVASELTPDNRRWQKAAAAALCVLITLASVNYAWLSNGNYRAQYYANRQQENYFNTMLTRVKSTEGYTDDTEIVFVGKNIDDVGFFDRYAGTPFTYGGRQSSTEGINVYSRESFIELYLGYRCRSIRPDEQSAYSGVIAGMKTYPNDGSILLIDRKILVRFE